MPDRHTSDLQRRLPEWIELTSLLASLPVGSQVHRLGQARQAEDDLSFPLTAISMGSQDPTAPVLGFFSGVHGLERIGTQVVLSLLSNLNELSKWDAQTQELLKRCRILFFPMINPIGIYRRTRANGNGVDLMRNSPVDAETKPTFMVGGHRISNRLPWYRGGPEMETESKALVQFCQDQFFQSKTVIALDFHSGFGVQDRIWFPYAKNTKPFSHLPEMMKLKETFDRSYPHHFYRIEPQTLNYTTHGDLWDYIYDLYREKNPDGVFLPLCLEMGSWMWVRKNPLQIFSALGPYNPMKPHRQKRILRRHHSLKDFLLRAITSHETWSQLSASSRSHHLQKAKELWYE